jgi:pimeloyl-ACP methyl ester carboxylesterase
MIINPFSIKVGKETLAGAILDNGNFCAPPRFIFLHGGGDYSIKERIYDFAEPILKKKINILTFDFSGHGESTGTIQESSLRKRTTEAKEGINQFVTESPIILCGASMGGYIALKILKSYNVKTLLLFGPALYDAKAYDVRFDQGFTQIIREPESWRNTDVLDALENFEGNVLIVMGQKDEVIPPGVIQLIYQHAKKARKKEIYTIANCPHKINIYLADYPSELAKLHHKIIEYIE